MKWFSVAAAVLLGLLVFSAAEASQPFEVMLKSQFPSGEDALHVKGELPSQAGWKPVSWVQTDNYLTLFNTKFNSVRIYLKRIKLPAENAETITAEEFVDKNLRPMLKRTQINSGPPGYDPKFEVVSEETTKVGADDLEGFVAEYSYDNPKGDMLAARYYVVKVGEDLHMATYTGNMDEFKALKPQFEAFLKTVKFFD
jgi:hypothetical protein